MAADFELDLLSLAISLYARSCFFIKTKSKSISSANWVDFFFFFCTCERCGKPASPRGGGGEIGGWKREKKKDVQEASFRRHISMNCLISDTSFGMVGERSEKVGFCSFLELAGFSIRNWQLCGWGCVDKG